MLTPNQAIARFHTLKPGDGIRLTFVDARAAAAFRWRLYYLRRTERHFARQLPQTHPRWGRTPLDTMNATIEGAILTVWRSRTPGSRHGGAPTHMVLVR